MTGAVDYTPFINGAKANISDPKAQGWLSGHNMGRTAPNASESVIMILRPTPT